MIRIREHINKAVIIKITHHVATIKVCSAVRSAKGN